MNKHLQHSSHPSEEVISELEQAYAEASGESDLDWEVTMMDGLSEDDWDAEAASDR